MKLRAMIHGDRCSKLAALLLAAIVFFAYTPTARAQSVAVAEVDGHVMDPSGQAIVGAVVKMTELDKRQVRTVSLMDGRFAIPTCRGRYRLEVTSSTASRPIFRRALCCRLHPTLMYQSRCRSVR